MATPNPLEDSHSTPPSSVSLKTFHIAGILTDVYGLDEVSPSCKSVSCLWLLHPRLQTKQIMASVAATCINHWNQRPSGDRKVGLIAVAFDQRNHGTREVKSLANEAWKQGNETHAQDMFSIFNGTAQDTSLLLDHLGSYIFNEPGAPLLGQHIAMGISLGGHSTWHLLFNEPRITAGVVIIGCPDYQRVMSDRARLSKLQTYTTGSSPGATFFGSKDFPLALVDACKKWDPKASFFGTGEITLGPSDEARQLLDAKLRGKKILVCSGGADKLVPYHCSEPFLRFLKDAVGGWYKDGGVYLEDNVYSGVGHAYSEGMVKDTTRFVTDTLAGASKLTSNL